MLRGEWNLLHALFALFLLSVSSGCVQEEPGKPLPSPEPLRQPQIGPPPEPAEAEVPPPTGPPQPPSQEKPKVREIMTAYKHVTERPSGWFITGQDADILLSGVDFNNSGGPLLFNHPKGLASDGKRLLLADTHNNRILIWNTLPGGNQKPDLVLGQKDFFTNNPGDRLDGLNWPVDVATDGERVLVADSYNNRILIWNSFPTVNGQKADIVLQGNEKLGIDRRGNIMWPWAVWTDGKKVVVTSTAGRQVLIWSEFPTRSNQPADIVLQLPGFGTPRSIASDGERLAVTDHNALGGEGGTFFWEAFPARDDEMYDFFIADPELIARNEMAPPPEGVQIGRMLWADFTDDGKFIALGDQIFIWNSFPRDEDDAPDYIVGVTSPGETGYMYRSGDGSGVASANGRLYLALSNGNKVVGFYSLPTRRDQKPDFAIGAPDVETNTLEANFFITNPVPATDGKSLLVSSDFDDKLYIWKKLPDESGAKPDFVYSGLGNPWDNALYGDTFVLAGGKDVLIWRNLPTSGEMPDIILRGSIGGVKFQEIKGVAIDRKYFYLADHRANKVYVWEGIPDNASNHLLALTVPGPWRLSSDGNYLAVTTIFDQSVRIYRVESLQDTPPAVVRGAGGAGVGEDVTGFNLPEMALVYNGSLFIADTGFNRVLAWKNIEDAIAGKRVDAILGEEGLQDTKPEIGRNKLFWPAGLAFDGSYLWVGEFKFSGRLLRYSVR